MLLYTFNQLSINSTEQTSALSVDFLAMIQGNIVVQTKDSA